MAHHFPVLRINRSAFMDLRLASLEPRTRMVKAVGTLWADEGETYASKRTKNSFGLNSVSLTHLNSYVFLNSNVEVVYGIAPSAIQVDTVCDVQGGCDGPHGGQRATDIQVRKSDLTVRVETPDGIISRAKLLEIVQFLIHHSLEVEDLFSRLDVGETCPSIRFQLDHDIGFKLGVGLIDTADMRRREKRDFARTKPHCNIGTIGHVDHGKTSLTAAIAKLADTSGATFSDGDDVSEWDNYSLNAEIRRVEYQTEMVHYAHVDFPGHADYVKGMLTDVVSAADGPMPQTREHLLLARQLGVAHLVVFMNKVDLVDDATIMEVVELEIRELLISCGFDGLTIPIIQGSALYALNGTMPEIGSVAVVALMAAIDEFVTHSRSLNDPVEMAMEGMLSITSLDSTSQLKGDQGHRVSSFKNKNVTAATNPNKKVGGLAVGVRSKLPVVDALIASNIAEKVQYILSSEHRRKATRTVRVVGASSTVGYTASPDFTCCVLDHATGDIADIARRTGALIRGPIPLPIRIKKFTANRGSHIDKKSREQFEVRTYKRLLDIVQLTPQTVDALMKLDLAAGVDVEIKLT